MSERQEWDVTSTCLKGNGIILWSMVWAHTVPTQPPTFQSRGGLCQTGRHKGKGKQHTTLRWTAWDGNWVGNTSREGFRGRTKDKLHCGEEIGVFSNVTLRLVQLVPAFVSTHGRRHCTILDLALYSCPPQHPHYLGWQRISHWSCDQVFQFLWSATLILVARDIR